MIITKMKELTIGGLTSRIPIIQGGMGVGVSLSGLSSAVANEGGIGVISAAGIGMDEPGFYSNYVDANIRALKKQIQKARETTKGIIGVNIMAAMSNFADMVKTAIDEKIDIIFSGAGLALNLPQFLTGSSTTKLVPIVSSGRAARLISKIWSEKYNYVPDAIVVEGPMAGGHLGFKVEQIKDPQYSLENIIIDVKNELKYFEEKFKKRIPVIAAGGIFSGADIYKIMQLGADGVQMGTRFVTTDECDASINFKNSYIEAKKEDIEIIKSPVGMPGRVILNKFICDVRAGEKKPYTCPYHCINTCDYKETSYCISLALMNAKKGFLENGFAFAGENVYKSNEITPVKQLIETLEKEYADAAMMDNI